jgi:MFS transporter, DHA1 family, multidrug resistance protein
MRALLADPMYKGFILGPPFWGPVSEKFGRKIPMLVGSGFSALFTLMPALGNNVPTILLGRFMAGAFGASPAAIVSGAATDNWGPIGRGINLTVCVGSIFGAPLLGPVVGNFIVQSASWRWVMWVMVILVLSITAFCAVFLSETYPPTILKSRARKLRKSTGDSNIKCEFDTESTSVKVVCQVYLVRPWGMCCAPKRPFLSILWLIIHSPLLHRAHPCSRHNLPSLHLWDSLPLHLRISLCIR